MVLPWYDTYLEKVSHNTICISIHVIYAIFWYTEISQQQPKDNGVPVWNDTYLDQFFCIMIHMLMNVSWNTVECHYNTVHYNMILWMRPANKRRRYIVTSSLIGWHIHKMIPEPVFEMVSNRQPKVRQWLRQNKHQRLYSQETPHTSPSQASYGMSFVRIWVKIDRVIMASHCITICSVSFHP